MYKLYFLSSHFFLNQIKKFSILTFFHPLNQTQIRENKIFLSFYFFIYPHFLFSHFFISTKRILRWCDIFCNFRFMVILEKNKIKQKILMSYYCNVHYINVFYSEPNASYCVICPLSLSLSLYDLQFQTFTFNLQPKKTTMTISCITASISILSHYQSAHDHGLVVDSL